MESWDIRSLAIEPHHPQVLRSDDETRAIAIRLPSGEELQEHQVHERAYLLVADGEIEISQDSNSVTGGTGFLSQFEPNERWTVRALSDARLVLVLAPWPGVGHPSRLAQPRAQGFRVGGSGRGPAGARPQTAVREQREHGGSPRRAQGQEPPVLQRNARRWVAEDPALSRTG
jgi:quercetin dioxygenase-like cupin family protein